MSNSFKRVKVLCEGQTEQKFVTTVLAPYLSTENIFLEPALITKKGQNGGNVKFERVKKDIAAALKQTSLAAVTTFIDYYGLAEWPGKNAIQSNFSPAQIASVLNKAVLSEIGSQFSNFNPAQRFIPFVAVHEFETLLFSDSAILSKHIGISQETVDKVLAECGEPERINNAPQTAPSKRLQEWDKTYGKTTTGISIAAETGIEKMRKQCPLFDEWLRQLETLQECTK